jgi:hypothetical protein
MRLATDLDSVDADEVVDLFADGPHPFSEPTRRRRASQGACR